MTVADILVYIDDTETNVQTMTAAQRLATQLNAHLTTVYIVPPVYTPVYIGIEAAIPASVVAQLDVWLRKNADEAKEQYEKTVDINSGKKTWLSLDGDRISTIKHVVKNYDLMVIGQPGQDDKNPEKAQIVNNIVLESGRPVIIIPNQYEKDSFGKRVMVAWNGKREAARAVHDALPFLTQAESVNIVSVNASKDIDIPCADIAVHLARHGVNVETEKSHTKSFSAGDEIMKLATTYGADMLVMGAYGHSRFREQILGGATKHVLSHMTVPVLMSH